MSTPIRLAAEGRFARLQAIEWWDQERLAQARVLVVGAGALGNEVVKNLSLAGVGHLAVVDRDRVELSNLSRSVLFSEEDEGLAKAACAARAAGRLNPQGRRTALCADVLSQVGLGLFRWADVVVGALDNREARVFVNSACARVGRPWIDGGIEVLQGVARGFRPPETACYECTMSRLDWELVHQSRSCAWLARRAVARRGTPTTPTTASVIGGVQAQEVLKLLHGLPSLLGAGFVFDGLRHSSYRVGYVTSPDCPWHEPAAPVEALDTLSSRSSLAAVWAAGADRLGALDALDLSREVVQELTCEGCGARETVLLPAERVTEARGACPACQGPRVPRFLHTLEAGSALLQSTTAALGLPPWDVLWARRGGVLLGLELSGDRTPVLQGSEA